MVSLLCALSVCLPLNAPSLSSLFSPDAGDTDYATFLPELLKYVFLPLIWF